MKAIFSISLLALLCLQLRAQPSWPDKWQHKDLKTDGVFGISTEKAYNELLKGKKSTTVLVAVIDSGVDTTHEDLKAVLWVNPREKDNGKDDDGNGYIDDLHGWNFIGGKKGDVQYDNLELTRIMRRDKDFYDSLSYSRVPEEYQKKYQAYRKMKKDFDGQLQTAQAYVDAVEKFKTALDTIVHKIGKENPTGKDFENYQTEDEEEKKVKTAVSSQLKNDPDLSHYQQQLEEFLTHFKDQADYQLNLGYDPRSIVGDNYNDSKERNYGNNDVYGPEALHGTHVAGIIGAVRNNNIGIDGIADNVRIMSVRTVPDGDERDKDVANAIRYAVDNGARVINMSFGKPYSWDKKCVDDAVKYAMSKDVLLIHAAGNDGKNLDDPDNVFYPNKYYADNSGNAKAWLTVGASGYDDDSTLVAEFSNYGKTTVDVFAPGVAIYSTVPGSRYQNEQGTSMAAPIVTGLAALIREYYPELTALQVKDIIMKSVVKVNHDVMIKDTGGAKKVPFNNVCVSGGVVNVYNALKLATTYK